MEKGYTPDTIGEDAPVHYQGLEPENASHKYFGGDAAQALSMSLNTVAARLAVDVGAKKVVRYRHRMGISSQLDASASIALGTSEVSPLELTAPMRRLPMAASG